MLGELAHGLGKIARDDVGQSDGPEHAADVRPQRDPDVLKGLRRAAECQLVRPAPRTDARGPSTERMTSAIVMSSAGRASQ